MAPQPQNPKPTPNAGDTKPVSDAERLARLESLITSQGEQLASALAQNKALEQKLLETQAKSAEQIAAVMTGLVSARGQLMVDQVLGTKPRLEKVKGKARFVLTERHYRQGRIYEPGEVVEISDEVPGRTWVTEEEWAARTKAAVPVNVLGAAPSDGRPGIDVHPPKRAADSDPLAQADAEVLK